MPYSMIAWYPNFKESPRISIVGILDNVSIGRMGMEECGLTSESQPQRSKGYLCSRNKGGRQCLEHSVIVQYHSASTHSLQEAAAQK